MASRYSFVIVLFLAFCFSAKAQTTNCVEGYSFKTVTKENENHSNINDIIIEWNLTNVQNIQNKTLVIEVQPLDNCWDELNGINRGNLSVNKIDKLSENIKGSLRLEHLVLNAKCFKWRVVITDNTSSCSTETPWEYKSFL